MPKEAKYIYRWEMQKKKRKKTTNSASFPEGRFVREGGDGVVEDLGGEFDALVNALHEPLARGLRVVVRGVVGAHTKDAVVHAHVLMVHNITPVHIGRRRPCVATRRKPRRVSRRTLRTRSPPPPVARPGRARRAGQGSALAQAWRNRAGGRREVGKKGSVILNTNQNEQICGLPHHRIDRLLKKYHHRHGKPTRPRAGAGRCSSSGGKV